ncbi:hypothetical protein GWK41_00905 [Persephonella atlantica]|uniref:Cytochrome c domain-containing protein n=1 Tax=Persephonella atlantica TaxID=2699429 RepID=A0ABS1GFC3_9AQUI|nr:hypothetical protein [Persephonella atlantica]MBK3331620.1 hypothetical protein [Persephonella atlantica]
MVGYLIDRIMIIFLLLTFNIYGEDSGYQIYKNSCAQCHIEKTTEFVDNLSLKAPPIDAITRQIKYHYRKKEEFIQYLVDFLSQPDAEKSVCKPCIKRWGLMPQIDIPDEEKQSVALWMFKNFK